MGVNDLMEEMSRVTEKLTAIQDNCSHPYIEWKYGSNTGNYDPSADAYWTEYHCKLCDKRWQQEGSHSPTNLGWGGVFEKID